MWRMRHIPKQAQREEAARMCRQAMQQGKPFAHLSSFARFEDFLPQVRAREQHEEAKKEIVAKRKKRSRAEPAHLVLHTQHTQHTQHTNAGLKTFLSIQHLPQPCQGPSVLFCRLSPPVSAHPVCAQNSEFV